MEKIKKACYRLHESIFRGIHWLGWDDRRLSRSTQISLSGKANQLLLVDSEVLPCKAGYLIPPELEF